jgi:cyclase
MKRPLVLGTIVIAGLLAATVFGQPPPSAPIDSIDKITDNLYRIPGQGGNSAVFVRGDGVLLVDTKLKDNGQALLDQIKKVTDKPITHIVNTHTHGDHTGSNMFFPASVEIVTQENTKTNMEKLPAFQDDKGKVGLPDRTFKDKMTLFSGKEAVDLYYFGPAHTNGDTFVVFRTARVMHSGDAFARKLYGETIGKAAAGIKNIDKVITGHGDVMGWQDFVDFGEFNRLFLDHAKASLSAGKTPEQALAEFKLPAKFTGYDLAASSRTGPGGNFNVIYSELRK